jgi:hypothetical protein
VDEIFLDQREIYCVYMYLREFADEFAEAGTPYYVGKGLPLRPYSKKHGKIIVPINRDYIKIVATNIDEWDAFDEEKRLIKLYGRKGYETGGILDNETLGGEGPSGYKYTDEQRAAHAASIIKLYADPDKGPKIRAAISASLSAAKIGATYSDAHRAAISASLKGLPKSDTHRAAISAASLKQFADPAARANLRANLRANQALANHTRWHVNRGIVKEDCSLCCINSLSQAA